jgi:ribose-phosphate pyrophosphokinase
MDTNRLKVFFGNSNPGLAKEICRHLGIKPGKIKILKFSNENIKVKIEENVRNADVFFIQTASHPVNENLIELLIAIDALRYASAGRITVVLPYYFYSRSDKKDEPRISITARLISDLVQTAGADRILTMKLHSPQIMGFSRIPVDQLLATHIMVDYYKQMDLSNTVIAAPDIGSAKGSRIFAKLLDLPLVILDKERLGDQERVQIQNIIGDAKGKNALLIDDEILSGGSIIEAAKFLKDHGANRIMAGCTHGFFTKNALKRIDESPIEEVVTTNTLPVESYSSSKKLKVLSVAELFADGIKAIKNGDSVGELFKLPEIDIPI